MERLQWPNAKAANVKVHVWNCIASVWEIMLYVDRIANVLTMASVIIT